MTSPAVPVPSAKKKVVILGGGLGSLVTAYELTATPELRARHEVTVYQIGWRLGGKGASGRNQERQDRIEEHGLHVWFGFYDNAFKLIQDCYKELDRAPGQPLATWQEAFKGHDFVMLNEYYKDQWYHWPFNIPPNTDVAGSSSVLPSFWAMAEMAVEMLLVLLADLFSSRPEVAARLDQQYRPNWLERIAADIGGDLEGLLKHGFVAQFHALYDWIASRDHRPNQPVGESHHLFASILDELRKLAWPIVQPHLDDQKARVFWITLDTAVTFLVGIIDDEILTHGFDVINNENLNDWMIRHGANPELTVRNGPYARAIYDAAFSYQDGDVNTPNFEAGTALRGLLRIAFTYKGSFLYKMQAGMGDTIFGPFYEVLKRRGVTFKFFHCVQSIGLDAQDSAVASIQIMPQVDLTVEEYDPLIYVKGLLCWPSEPLWSQIQDGAALKAAGVNLEETCVPVPGKQPITLEAGKDFDLVVLGISIAALPAICNEWRERKPAWQTMFDKVKTVETQAFQLWFNQTLDEMGWKAPRPIWRPFSKGIPTPIWGTYVEPLDTYADMSHLIVRENWPQQYNLGSIAYFCGALPDKGNETQHDANERVKQNARAFLSTNIPYIWPKAGNPDDPTQPGVLNWSLLIDPLGRQGLGRLDAQFFRANITPTERYVLAVTGSTIYRLTPGGSGIDNLYLTGDWTRNGLNCGCVEATVMAGMECSRAMCGSPKTIVGETDNWL